MLVRGGRATSVDRPTAGTCGHIAVSGARGGLKGDTRPSQAPERAQNIKRSLQLRGRALDPPEATKYFGQWRCRVGRGAGQRASLQERQGPEPSQNPRKARPSALNFWGLSACSVLVTAHPVPVSLGLGRAKPSSSSSTKQLSSSASSSSLASADPATADRKRAEIYAINRLKRQVGVLTVVRCSRFIWVPNSCHCVPEQRNEVQTVHD